MRARSFRCLSRSASVLGTLAAVLLTAPRAFACGVSSVDGSWSCTWADYEEAVRPRWQAGVAALHTRTRLRFSDDVRATQFRNAVVATAAYAPTASLSLQLNAGAAFGGELQTPQGDHRFSVGPTLAAGIAYTLRAGQPFIVLSGVLAATFARTRLEGAVTSVGYGALDVRIGAVVGVTLFDVLRPYAVARAFGGPVFWRHRGDSVTGTDVYHYQLGLGLSLRMIETLALFVEGIPLGERALSGGAALVF